MNAEVVFSLKSPNLKVRDPPQQITLKEYVRKILDTIDPTFYHLGNIIPL